MYTPKFVQTPTLAPAQALDPNEIKKDFPILSLDVRGKPLVYLDNAATSQKPQVVIDSIVDYYTTANANVHRGISTLSERSSEVWEQARATIAHFFGAKLTELIMTSNATEAFNGIAYGWADKHLQRGDMILTSILEHHSNLVVWQEVAKKTGAQLAIVGLTSEGLLDLDQFENILLSDKVRLVSLTQVSNVLGLVVDLELVAELINKHHSRNQKPVLVVDGTQAATHLPMDFSQNPADFYVASGHKMLGPMGSGILLVKENLLRGGEFQPWLFGGGMIDEVSQEGATYSQNLEEKFVAGTPNVEAGVGLAAACHYLTKLGMNNVYQHSLELTEYALGKLRDIEKVRLVGPMEVGTYEKPLRLGSVAFTFEGVSAHEVAQVLDREGIAVRSGHHCAMPLHQNLNLEGTVRASFQVYNSREDIDALVDGLGEVKKVFI